MKRSKPGISRRHLLSSASASGVAVPAMPALAADVPAIEGAPREVTLAWMPTTLCYIALPVADKRGPFTRHNLDVQFVNWAGSTDLLLEAISIGNGGGGSKLTR